MIARSIVVNYNIKYLARKCYTSGMNRFRGEQQSDNTRVNVAKSVGSIILGASILTGCGSMKDGSWQNGPLNDPSWDIGTHLAKVTLGCNNKVTGANQAIITGLKGEAWGANIKYGHSGLGVGVSENPNGEYRASRDMLETNHVYTGHTGADSNGTIEDSSEQIHLQVGSSANTIVATCYTSSRHLQPHGTPVSVTVP